MPLATGSKTLNQQYILLAKIAVICILHWQLGIENFVTIKFVVWSNDPNTANQGPTLCYSNKVSLREG